MAGASDELALIGARLKATGAKELTTMTRRRIKAAAAPLVPLLRESARSNLPKRGGLNEKVAAGKFTTSVRFAGRTTGVSIKSTQKGNYTDTGTWRHPVFASNKTSTKWVEQTYEPAAKWWEKVSDEHATTASAEMVSILAEVAADLGMV